METLFYITEIMIESVRHLKNISIPINSDKIKHVILTGKNGSGKTSVLDAIASFLDNTTANDSIYNARKSIEDNNQLLKSTNYLDNELIASIKNNLEYYNDLLKTNAKGETVEVEI